MPSLIPNIKNSEYHDANRKKEVPKGQNSEQQQNILKSHLRNNKKSNREHNNHYHSYAYSTHPHVLVNNKDSRTNPDNYDNIIAENSHTSDYKHTKPSKTKQKSTYDSEKSSLSKNNKDKNEKNNITHQVYREKIYKIESILTEQPNDYRY